MKDGVGSFFLGPRAQFQTVKRNPLIFTTFALFLGLSHTHTFGAQDHDGGKGGNGFRVNRLYGAYYLFITVLRCEGRQQEHVQHGKPEMRACSARKPCDDPAPGWWWVCRFLVSCRLLWLARNETCPLLWSMRTRRNATSTGL